MVLKNYLDQGIIIVYNYALQDYCSPITEFVKYVKQQGGNKDDEVGNSFMMYLHASLGEC